ncbi:MAG: glycyl-radical enzyme activating protein [Lachnospiraceae bacterium]|nr:glycyl-radical enzyme activating protein [Lachnospiraceae bacterium]
MKGNIFNIQKFSIHDGPGVRTTVFLKGCPLQCAWCANPESQDDQIQILYDERKCVHCQTCVHTCPQHAISYDNKIHIDDKLCVGCLQCISNCPQRALSHEGEMKDLEEVVHTCLQDIDFYEESGGGVTISGGEGMCQPDFVEALIQELKKSNIHTAIETTGCVSPAVFQRLAPQFDLLLYDVKQYDSEKHWKGTKMGNEQIIENLTWASERGLNILPRIPVIPGFNAELEDAEGISNLLLQIGLKKAQLLPFHQFGENKYKLLDRNYELKEVPALHPEDLTDYQKIFLDKGINCFF